MNSLIRKFKENKGGIAVNTAIALPAMLLIAYMIMDLLYIANQRNDIQRRADSATLAITANAKLDTTDENTDYFMDPEGNLIYCTKDDTADYDYETETANGKYYCSVIKDASTGLAVQPCEITRESYEKGIAQLKKDLPGENYSEEEFDAVYDWDNLTDEYKASLKSGIAELRFAGRVYGLFSKYGGFDWSYRVYIESQAVCVVNKK